MAKRKTPKTEKVIDLTPKAEKITDEQLKKVQEVVNSINRSQIELGQLETRKHELLHSVAGIKDELSLLQSELKKEFIETEGKQKLLRNVLKNEADAASGKMDMAVQQAANNVKKD